MIIYIDLLIILNYFFDFLILLTVNITLKRYISIKRILLTSILGEISLLILFINNIYLSIILKFITSIILNIVCFKYKDILYTINNITYFYMVSTILGGFIYLLKLNNINYLLIVVISPIVVYLYIKQSKNIKLEVNNYYNVKIIFKEKIIDVVGYLDTGNKLVDPVTKKDVLLLNKELLQGDINIRTPIYVPYHSLNNKGLVKCIKPIKLIIDNKYYTNFLVGLMDEKIGINGVDCIISLNILEGLHV